MGKVGVIFGTIALIISLIVAGLFIFDKFTVSSPVPPPPEENQWYDTNNIAFFMAPGEAWGSLVGINIDFEVGAGQKVYFLFITDIIFDNSSIPNSYVEIHFEVDGIRWNKPTIYVKRFAVASPGGIRLSASVQHYNSTMTEGLHYISLMFRGSNVNDAIWDSSLFVQTFN